jgi:hypothetical protein
VSRAARFYLIVNDIETTRAELVARGVDVSEVFHRGITKDSRLGGPDPERRSYASFVTFDDPDGNNWLVQEVTQLARTRERRHSDIHLINRPCGSVATRRGRAWRAREADGSARRRMGRLVRRVHRPGTDRPTIAYVSPN